MRKRGAQMGNDNAAKNHSNVGKKYYIGRSPGTSAFNFATGALFGPVGGGISGAVGGTFHKTTKNHWKAAGLGAGSGYGLAGGLIGGAVGGPVGAALGAGTGAILGGGSTALMHSFGYAGGKLVSKKREAKPKYKK